MTSSDQESPTKLKKIGAFIKDRKKIFIPILIVIICAVIGILVFTSGKSNTSSAEPQIAPQVPGTDLDQNLEEQSTTAEE